MFIAEVLKTANRKVIAGTYAAAGVGGGGRGFTEIAASDLIATKAAPKIPSAMLIGVPG